MKQNLRDEIKGVQEILPEEAKGEKCEKIKQRLFSLPEFINAKTVMFYVSMKDEVNTHNMIREALLTKRVVVPVCEKETLSLKLSELKDFSELQKGSYGVLEPKPEFICPVPKEEIDLVVVPGHAFDETGLRVGRGKGYYDRFLGTISAPTVALAYDFQVMASVPSEPHDVPVDQVVTEERIIECRRRGGTAECKSG